MELIINEDLGITSDDVARCDDIPTLKLWHVQMMTHMSEVKRHVRKTRSKYEKNIGSVDFNRYAKSRTYRDLQKALLTQIQGRIAFLKAKKREDENDLKLRLKFWKSKMEFLMPKMIEELREECRDFILENTHSPQS